jgi:transcriptional regulator
MYVPRAFQESDPDRVASLVRAYPFAMLVTAPDGVPFVSHLPILYDSSAGTHGRLLGHMARANPQWRDMSSDSEVLVVVQGPHCYVSPAWYASPGVPTWNYAVAHLRGRPRLIHDAAGLATLVERLTRVHEAGRSNPWQPNLAGEAGARLPKLIVGFEIEVARIQAKFKLSQNRPEEDRARVIAELRGSASQADMEVARLMTGILEPPER